jgi:hypothetical protein
MMAKDKEIISCVCMTCGVRNDHSNESGYCQNGHDDWLEYRDVTQRNQWFYRALNIFQMTSEEFTLLFMDNSVKQFDVLEPGD